MATATQQNRFLAVSTPLGKDVLLLTTVDGDEEMSRLFLYRLEMLSLESTIEPKQIVGKNVTFTVKLADGSPRHFNGIVRRFSEAPHESGFYAYHAEVVPWLWFLTRTADCRIFQSKSVPEILEQVFQDLGFSDFELELKGTHKKRDYCVQYRETDFDFVSRLMEEEGIFYYFRHADGKHTLVLADQKDAYKDLPENEVEYQYSYQGTDAEDRLTAWEHRYEFISGKFAQTDYNFADHPARGEPTPATLLMADEKSVVKLDGVDKFEVYDYPGKHQEKDDGKTLARLRVEEIETPQDTVHAAGTCKTFNPGGKFKIKRHHAKSEEGKKYVITSIRHVAREPAEYTSGARVTEDYGNTFTCIPESVVFRPRRTTPKPTIQGVQTAVVTGPPGEEIYPDKYGRVKVQFFWDREGKRDENSSCWVRVSQNYAGKGWGEMSIPRIGQEVIVSFLEGDPDRPIITGRVYNGDQMPPYALPAQKTLTGLKSNSTIGGGGYNEYVMDDTKGKELIREHGQFDKDSTIEHDLREHVLHDRQRTVDNDETIHVGHDRTETVDNDETITIHGNRTETVDKDESITIGGSRSEAVGKDESITIGDSRAETVGKDESVTIGKDKSVTIGGDRSASVGKNDTLNVGKNLVVNAGDQIVLETGAAKIIMKKDGTIQIQGKDVTIKASGNITAKASKNMVLKGRKILEN